MPAPVRKQKPAGISWIKIRTRREAWELPSARLWKRPSVTNQEKTRYSLGSVLNHVMLHQTIIGLEAKKQLEKINAYPDVIIGCAGGGSNFAGLSFPFVLDKMNGKEIDIYPG